ncbi:MAG: nitroreductase family protein [Deltaproteobacteria bacterium]|nr:nitroreductase family protein [Deltaproteobacteria bacterium]
MATAIRTRRSHKLFTGEVVPDRLLAEWVELATWAPNHKFTEPWRFTVVPHRALPSLVAAIGRALQAQSDLPAEKSRAQTDKIAAILAGAGGAIAVRQSVHGADPERQREDYAACACAIQNIQLAAWAQGFGSYWTTSDAFIGPALDVFWHKAPGEVLVGVVVLGRAAVENKAVRYKKPEELTIWLDVPEIGV